MISEVTLTLPEKTILSHLVNSNGFIKKRLVELKNIELILSKEKLLKLIDIENEDNPYAVSIFKTENIISEEKNNNSKKYNYKLTKNIIDTAKKILEQTGDISFMITKPIYKSKNSNIVSDPILLHSLENKINDLESYIFTGNQNKEILEKYMITTDGEDYSIEDLFYTFSNDYIEEHISERFRDTINVDEYILSGRFDDNDIADLMISFMDELSELTTSGELLLLVINKTVDNISMQISIPLIFIPQLVLKDADKGKYETIIAFDIDNLIYLPQNLVSIDNFDTLENTHELLGESDGVYQDKYATFAFISIQDKRISKSNPKAITLNIIKNVNAEDYENYSVVDDAKLDIEIEGKLTGFYN